MATEIQNFLIFSIFLTAFLMPPITIQVEYYHHPEYEFPFTPITSNIDKVVDGETECARKCDGKPLTCYYKLYPEPYSTMGPACGKCPENMTACGDPQCIPADGVERGVYVFNRQLPGPTLQVCAGDKIVVDVINLDAHRSTSVHWHGFKQKGTPYSDGVPYVTQCPINPAQSYRYIFYAEEAGSYFYHSHSGIQKIDGMTGPIIVKNVLSKEPYGALYDYDEHVMFLQDWIHGLADNLIPGLRKGPVHGSMPNIYLINGHGVNSERTNDLQSLISSVKKSKHTPISEFTVKPGKRYRFRIISSTCLACPVSVIIQGHQMKVINADGPGPVEPVSVDVVSLNSGDRFDVIIEANKKIDSYWVLVRGDGSCKGAMQIAVLKYHGSNGIPSSDVIEDVNKNSVILNPTNPTCEKPEELCVSKLSSPYQAPPYIVKGQGNVRLLLQFGFYFYQINELFNISTYHPYFEPAEPLLVRAQINSITNKFAPMPLLSQYHDIPRSAFCSKTCHTQHLNCHCLNVYRIPLHSVVDLIVTDTASPSKTGLAHPFHLHGFFFYVLRIGTFKNGLEEGVRELNKWLDEGAMKNKSNAVLKDSIGIPSGGYAVVRFYADNPGFWIFHCHFTLHLDMGMSAVLQVGELNEMPSPPPNFPKCGNFLPPINSW